MATQVDSLLQRQSEIRKKKVSGRRERENLEREVSMLQQRLNEEEKVHQILEHFHKQQKGSSVNIPSSLPPNMQELLAELAMVEGEIAHLEGQISKLQMVLKREQEATQASKSKQQQHQPRPLQEAGTLSDSFDKSPDAAKSNQMSRSVPERMAFETKALHFISKAIKGDYTLNDFRLNENLGSLKSFSDQKENLVHEEVKVQDRFPRKSGLLKHPSPLRDPRHPSPKQRERNPAVAMDLLPRSFPSPLLPEPEESNNQILQPNKLSESILKCLNFIYVRLLRTARAVELEKSGPITRSMHSSLSSRSFRVENGLNSSLMLQKESRQRDPYGIFNSEVSIPRDIGPYKNLVIFTSSSMDPKFISSPSSVSLLRKLRALMNNLQIVDLKSLTHKQKLAFWINMYNACIMHGFLQFAVPSSPEKLVALMNKATLNIGGNIINAQAIEHYILRKREPSNSKEGGKSDKETIVRELYGLESPEPNVTFALCCGTRSSPAVRIYTAESVASELDKAKLEYLQASIVVTSSKTIALPELLVRNLTDFATDVHSMVEWICHQLPTSGSLRKSMVDCFRGHTKMSGSVEKIPYDFEFQYLLAI